MTQLLFRNFQLLEPEIGELQGGFELLVDGETVREVSAKPIKARCRRCDRLRRAHLDAGPDRQPRSRHLERGQFPLSRSRAADADDGPRGAAHARHAQPRLHHRPRHRRRRLGFQDGRRTGRHSGAAPVHRGCRDRADRRPQRPAPAHRSRPALPLLRRHALRHAPVRRHLRGAQGNARADAPGRRPHQDHDVGRRRLSL